MADTFADKFKTSSSHLQNFDYSTSGNYFITICTLNKNNFFGKIINLTMELNQRGLITNDCLIQIPNHFNNIILNEFVIMPNHIHLLLNLNPTPFNPVETHHDASLTTRYNSYYFHRIAIRSSQTIPLVIKQFKSSVKRQCNQQNLFFAWQSRYHDHIVKDKLELIKIKNYIINNPTNWDNDKFYKNK